MSALRVLLIWVVLFASVALAQAPAVVFSTYLGVGDCDGVALGSNGDLYLACHSPSNHLLDAKQLPEKSASAEKPPSEDAFDAYVLRVNPTTGKLIYATRVGGSKYDEAAKIKVDRNGFAYVVGQTQSRDFPTTPDAVQKQYGGGESDGFFIKVAPDGHIVYATFLGGNGADDVDGLDVDDHGGVFIGGMTDSTDFPGQSKAQTPSKGHVFVSHLVLGHSEAFHSVVFGGQGEEYLTGVALDGRGGLFATGFTKSSDFPTLHPVQPELRGVSDLFLARFSTSSLTLTFSTFFGGSGDDSGWGVTVDGLGNPIVAGTTDSQDLPTSPGAYQRASKGGKDAFIAKFDGNNYHNVRSTYWGGSKDDFTGHDGDPVKVDSNGNIWLVGGTASLDLPTRNAFQTKYGGGDMDGFLMAFSPDLARVCYSTYRGGSDREFLEGLDLSKTGLVYATGVTWSKDLQMSANATQKALAPVNYEGKFVNNMLIGIRLPDACLKSPAQ